MLANMFRCGKNILKQRENHSQHDNNLTSDQKTRSKSKRSTAGESASQKHSPRKRKRAHLFKDTLHIYSAQPKLHA